MNKFKKIIYIAFFVAVLSVSMVTLLVSFELMDGYKLYAVQSSSMEPAVNKGSLVVVKSANSYQLDDIISFTSKDYGNIVITHRLVAKDYLEGGVAYETKGDANPKADISKLTYQDIVGKVIVRIPLLGYLTTYARTQAGLIFLIVVPSTIIIYSEILRIKNELKSLAVKRKFLGRSISFRNITIFSLLLALANISLTNTYLMDYEKVGASFLASIEAGEVEETELDFYFSGDKNRVGFTLTDTATYDWVDYQITYEHDGGLTEGIDGSINNAVGDDSITREWFTLGSCSSGGVCVYHDIESSIELIVEVYSGGSLQDTLTASLVK